MKILVTGANGLLGQKLSALLVSDETVDPILTARKPLSFPQRRSTLVAVDIADRDVVTQVFEEYRPDVVINAAAMTLVDLCEMQQDECWKCNVTAVENLIHAGRKINTHLIQVSTDFIFDGTKGPLDEAATPNPVNFYGKTKAEAESLLIQSGMKWTILRTVLVYGVTADQSRSNIVLWVKENLEQGKPIRVVNDQWRTPTLAEDLAMGCYLAAIKEATGIYHISGKDFMTPYDIAVRTAELFDLDKKLITPTDSTQFTQTAKRPLRTGFIIEKAKRELGYQPRSFDDGLRVLSQQLATSTAKA